MAYEAEREWLLTVLPPSDAPPAGFAAPTHDAYRAGLRRGASDAMQFEAGNGSATPPEFEWEFEEAWRVGYEAGSDMGALRREILWKLVTDQHGVASTPVYPCKNEDFLDTRHPCDKLRGDVAQFYLQ